MIFITLFSLTILLLVIYWYKGSSYKKEIEDEVKQTAVNKISQVFNSKRQVKIDSLLMRKYKLK